MKPNSFYPKLVCRTSLFPVEIDLEEVLTRRKDFDLLMQAVYFSSPEFYYIMLKSIQSGEISERVQETINKYFKRTKFRSTPFGLFGGIGVVSWDLEDNLERGKFVVHYDLESKAKICLDEKFRNLGDFYLNPTIYKKKNEFRFYGYELGEEIYFRLKSLSASSELSKIMRIFRNKGMISRSELITIFSELGGDFEDLFKDLVNFQFILSSNRSKTGVFYNKQRKYSNIERLIQDMVSNLNINPGNFKTTISYNKFLQKKVPLLFSKKSSFHAVRIDQFTNESISKKHQHKIISAYKYVKKLIENPTTGSLDNFVRKFNLWYESHVIPIMSLFDPDSGFDEYISLSSNFVNQGKNGKDKGLNLEQERIFDLMLKTNQSILDVHGGGKDIVVEHNTCITVKFQLFDEDMIYIEKFIGKSPLSYFSRFSSYHSDISNLCSDIGRIQYEDTAEYIYAEIITVSEYVSLNVVNAQVITNYAIGIFENPIQISEKAEINIIPINDLLVGVKNNKPILYSRNLKKVVIPVLTNAYNYHRSNLPIYKFLCSIAKDQRGIDFDFGLYIQNKFKQKHIPRIVLNKKIILSKEKWTLNEDVISKELGIDKIETFISRFKEIKKFYCLNDQLEILSQDHPIQINLTNKKDILLLAKEFYKRKNLVVEEFLFSKYKSVIKNQDDGTYYHEFLGVFTVNGEKPTRQNIPIIRKRTIFLPFQKGWLYMKIYCNHAIANKYLSIIYKILKSYSIKIEKWFFIRYEDPDFHLRVRIKFNDEQSAMKFYFDFLKLKFEEAEFQKNIFEITLNSYQREMIRYERIELAERLFEIDSDFTINLINKKTLFTEMEVLVLIVYSINSYLKIFSLNRSKFILFLENRRVHLKTLYSLGNENKSDLFDISRKQWSLIYQKLNKPFVKREIELSEIADEVKRLSDPYKFIVDILHLLCNRILEIDQNQKEFVVITILIKHLRSTNSNFFGQ